MSRRVFSWLDAVVLVCLAAVMFQFLIACGEITTTQQQRMGNGVQIRGIHRGLVVYGQMNNGYYPGLNGSGRRTPATPATDETMYACVEPSNTDISAVYARLLTSELIKPRGVISALDANEKEPVPHLPVLYTVTRKNYSYAMLQFGAERGNEGRRREWRNTTNSRAPIVGDRGKAIDATMIRTGMHDGDTSGDAAKWQGNIGWNDNHVTFETTGMFAPGRINLDGDANPELDNLFDAADGFSADSNAKFSYR